MSAQRDWMGRLFGRRLPVTAGRLYTEGPGGRIEIVRDEWGVPHITAVSSTDAWFALGFCLGQDRGFQLETMLRAARGTVAELVGKRGLRIDRLSRRIGFVRAARAQLEVIDDRQRAHFGSYVAGINAAYRVGVEKLPHEFALTHSRPSVWTAADALAVAKLVAFGLALNWDVELARLKVLELDGEQALRDLDPGYPEWHPVVSPPTARAGRSLDALCADIEGLRSVVSSGGSNAWALAPERTATGRPILANDPHTDPTVPPLWYLAHIRTTEWELAGATTPGLLGVAAGHNGKVAWGTTNGAADSVDLFLEQLDPKGLNVRVEDGWERCVVIDETIRVRGFAPDVRETVVVTPRGPLISPALEEKVPAVSMSAIFLHPGQIGGFLALHDATCFDDVRAAFAQWPWATLNVACADRAGDVGWLLAGELPRRQRGYGMLPRSGECADATWGDFLSAEEMPFEKSPGNGFIVTANNRPVEGDEPFLGADWADGYRAQVISEALGKHHDWTIEGCAALQLDRRSLPWEELRESILAAGAEGPNGMRAHELLAKWDGRVTGDSAAATVFELLLAELCNRAARRKAPTAHEWALGKGLNPIFPFTFLAYRRVGHLVKLIVDDTQGWWPEGWAKEIRSSLEVVASRLLAERGPCTEKTWAWGTVRPLTLLHPAAEGNKPLGKVFNLGPIPFGGDTNTVAQASCLPLSPTANPPLIPAMRMVIDVGEWDNSQWVLASGQSGNPCSRHYSDHFELWRHGRLAPMLWSQDAVAKAARSTLELLPIGHGEKR